MKNMNKQGGFTLIEVVIVMAVVAVLAGAITPFAIQMVGARREVAARKELQSLKKAVIGEAKKTVHGEEFTFGFVGDIGNVPDSLDRLKTIGSLPANAFNTTKDLGAGWNGPYIMEEFGGDFKDDPWGTDYSYSTASGTNADLGVDYLATITSAGPDRTLSTSDDLSVEILKPEVHSDVIGTVKYASGSPAPSVSVTMNYPNNGTLTTAADTTDSEGYYEFSDIPIGDRTITASPGLLYVPGTAVTTIIDSIKFTVANYSSSNISITSLTPVFSGGLTYKEVWIDEVKVYDNSGTASGATISFSSQTLTGSTGTINPFLVRVQSQKVQPPDIIIDRIEEGGFLIFELKIFKTGGGGQANMTGVSLSVTFSDGSVATFTVDGG